MCNKINKNSIVSKYVKLSDTIAPIDGPRSYSLNNLSNLLQIEYNSNLNQIKLKTFKGLTHYNNFSEKDIISLKNLNAELVNDFSFKCIGQYNDSKLEIIMPISFGEVRCFNLTIDQLSKLNESIINILNNNFDIEITNIINNLEAYNFESNNSINTISNNIIIIGSTDVKPIWYGVVKVEQLDNESTEAKLTCNYVDKDKNISTDSIIFYTNNVDAIKNIIEHKGFFTNNGIYKLGLNNSFIVEINPEEDTNLCLLDALNENIMYTHKLNFNNGDSDNGN